MSNNLYVDVSGLRKGILSTEDNLKKFETNLKEYTENLKSSKDCWVDDSTETFGELVVTDEEVFAEYNQAVKKQLEGVTNFCDMLESVITQNLEISALNNIKYYDSIVNNALNSLDDAISKISQAKSHVATMYVPPACGMSAEIKGLLNDVDTREINSLKEKIANTISGIARTISTSQSEMASIPVKEIDTKVIEDRYQTTDLMSVDKVDYDPESERYNVDQTDKIRNVDNPEIMVEKTNYNIEENEFINTMKTQQIEVEDKTGQVSGRTDINLNNKIFSVNTDNYTISNEKTEFSTDNSFDKVSLEDSYNLENGYRRSNIKDLNITVNDVSEISNAKFNSNMKTGDVQLKNINEVENASLNADMKSIDVTLKESGDLESAEFKTDFNGMDISVKEAGKVESTSFNPDMGTIDISVKEVGDLESAEFKTNLSGMDISVKEVGKAESTSFNPDMGTIDISVKEVGDLESTNFGNN